MGNQNNVWHNIQFLHICSTFFGKGIPNENGASLGSHNATMFGLMNSNRNNQKNSNREYDICRINQRWQNEAALSNLKDPTRAFL